MAPRVGSSGEDDGYLVTFTIDMVEDRSQALVFDASRGRWPDCPRHAAGADQQWYPFDVGSGFCAAGWDAA